jgi:hypothetical protein
MTRLLLLVFFPLAYASESDHQAQRAGISAHAQGQAQANAQVQAQAQTQAQVKLQAHQQALASARRKAQFWSNARKELQESLKHDSIMMRVQSKREKMKRTHGKVTGMTLGTSDGAKSTHSKAMAEIDASAKVVRSVQKSMTSSNSSTVKSAFWLGMRKQLEAQKQALPDIVPYKGMSTKRSSAVAKEVQQQHTANATSHGYLVADLTEFPKGPPAKGSVHGKVIELLTDVIQMLR